MDLTKDAIEALMNMKGGGGAAANDSQQDDDFASSCYVGGFRSSTL